MTADVSFRLNGETVSVPAEGSLLDAVRDRLGDTSVKDGCSPQGQCGACTVLVNGEARVSCVTSITRVANADVTTVEGLDPATRDQWVAAFESTGAAQCGFCTPGILCRLVSTAARRGLSDVAIERALAAHLCRCTGWQPIVEAATLLRDGGEFAPRDPHLAAVRAGIEQGVPQAAGPDVVLGRAPYADDTAPLDAQLWWTNGTGEYVAARSRHEARQLTRAVQGRNSSAPVRPVLPIPPGDWAVSLQTTFCEPAYVEPDTSWCEPGGEPSSPAANAGAFGAKRRSVIRDDAHRVANETGQTVIVAWSREAVVRKGKKRPPLSLGLHSDGSGVVHVAVTPQSDDLSELVSVVRGVLPDVTVELHHVNGPPVGATHRGAVLAELLAARATIGRSAGEPITVTSPNGSTATVTYRAHHIDVVVNAGEPLCEVTLRSYVMGAVHQAVSMVWSEGIALNSEGEPVDLTIRSFGVVPAAGTPSMSVTIEPSSTPAVAVGGAVFAATLAAVWLHEGGTSWPTRRKDAS